MIINLAAVHRDDVMDRSKYYATNVDGTRNLCRIADEVGIKKIIFVSTCAVYGFCDPDTDENGVTAPFNDYGQSKLLAEQLLRDWYDNEPETRQLFIVRPTVVFGEGNRGNVYNLLDQINRKRFVMIGKGLNRKSIAYVGNVAAYLLYAATKTDGFSLVNYADKPDLTMNELILNVRREAGKYPAN